MDRIDLHDIQLDCILGVLDSEQRAQQPFVGAISMWLDLDSAGHTGHLHETVNYADVTGWVTFLTRHGRFRLLESISVGMLRLMLLPPAPAEERAQIERASITLKKPTILAPVTTPGTRFERSKEWAPVDAFDAAEGVSIETLVDTGRSAAWRVHIQPGVTWPVMADHAVYVIAGRVQRPDGVSFGANTALPSGDVESMTNAGEVTASLLVVRVPDPPGDDWVE